LIAGVPKIEEAGFGAPKMLVIPPEVILGPKRLDPPVDAALLKPNFWGAGVLVGVVDSWLKIDLGFASGGGVVLSISSSLAGGAAGCLDAASSESPNPPPKRDLDAAP
jgi:hypothetical protein